MAYTINRFNGVPFITVEDGTLDSTTDLKLVGKNYTGYGEAQNENFLHLLESFSGEVAPGKPITGMIWYDTVTEKIRVYDGVSFKATGGAEVSATTPAGLAEGDLWWDTTTNQLKALNVDNEWILIGPQRAGSGNTEMKSIELVDTTATRQAVIATYVSDKIVAIQSSVEFTPNNTQDAEGWQIVDFPVIKAGFNVAGVNSDGYTVLDSTSQVNQYWGTASTAYKLVSGTTTYSPSDFLQAGPSLALLSTITKFGDGGFTLGDDDDIVYTVQNGNQPNTKLASDYMSYTDSTDNTVYIMTNNAFYPNTTDTKTLGTVTKKFNNVYATTFTGTASQSDLLKEQQSGLYRVGDRTANADTVAVRDSDGDLIARLFEGTATKARYADLAEKYTTCCELEPGTAVAVSADEDHEVAPASASDFCIGVVSTDPAIMMNSEAEGQYIALKGRVPVRVKGPVKKGQAVYALQDGVCTTLATTALVGIALETNTAEEEKKVECVLKT
jgi:hypothetical protein